MCWLYSIHATSGCDTVSQFIGTEEIELFNLISKKTDIARGLEPFLAAEYDEASVKTDVFDIIAGLNNMKGSKYEDVRPMLVEVTQRYCLYNSFKVNSLIKVTCLICIK